MRFVHHLQFLSLPMVVLGAALTLACSDREPTEPTPTPSFAVSSGPLSVEPRSIRLRCDVGATCTTAVMVTASSPVTLTYQIEGEGFIINSPLTSCPQGGTHTGGTCWINVKIVTAAPGRPSATLVISESTFGTSVTVRLNGRVS